MKIKNPDCVEAFNVSMFNPSSTSIRPVIAFDATRIVASVTGISFVNASGATAGLLPTSLTTISSPIFISGFNILDNNPNREEPFPACFIFRASIDGKVKRNTLSVNSQRRNTQFQRALMTVNESFVVDGQTAFVAYLLPLQSIELTFFVKGFL